MDVFAVFVLVLVQLRGQYLLHLGKFPRTGRSLQNMVVLFPSYHLQLGIMPIAKIILIKINVSPTDTNQISAILCQSSAQSNTTFHYDSVTAQNFHGKKTVTMYLQAKFIGQILTWSEDHFHGGSTKLFFQRALPLDRSQFL